MYIDVRPSGAAWLHTLGDARSSAIEFLKWHFWTNCTFRTAQLLFMAVCLSSCLGGLVMPTVWFDHLCFWMLVSGHKLGSASQSAVTQAYRQADTRAYKAIEAGASKAQMKEGAQMKQHPVPIQCARV